MTHYLVGIDAESWESGWEACFDWHCVYIFRMTPGLITVLRRALLPDEARDAAGRQRMFWFKLEEGDPLLQAARSRRSRDDSGELSFHRDDILERWDVYDPKTGAVDMA